MDTTVQKSLFRDIAQPEQAGCRRFSIQRVEGKNLSVTEDALAVEEPLEIRIENKSVSITMRTPGYDFELAAGFLFTEGIIRGGRDIQNMRYCGPDLVARPRTNVVRVELRPGLEFDLGKLNRHFYTSSSCGVCGKSSIEALKTQSAFRLENRTLKWDADFIHELPELLRKSQGIFDATGGLHASALFSDEQDLLILREDVGRHNALDKLIGHAVINDLLPLRRSVLVVSGRASFELVQKASMAGIEVFAAVGAPSSLAVELARESGMTLLGFVRNRRFNVYSHESRIRFLRSSS